ncbi:MAG: hypothetical protein PVG22_03050 [Chromatiales bacterium]|jgi:hypothetical protein
MQINCSAGFRSLHCITNFTDTWIGSASVQHMVHRRDGRVRAEAEKYPGVTFYLTLADL